MRQIEFIKDFATRKKGELIFVDSMLANTLINKGVEKATKPIKKK